MTRTHPGESTHSPTARDRGVRPAMHVRALAAVSCGLGICFGLGCEGPTLWIGDAVQDAGVRPVSPPPPPPMVVPMGAAGASAPPEKPIEVTPPLGPPGGVATGTQRPTGTQKPAEPPRDASVIDDGDDAGTPDRGPRQPDPPVTQPTAVLRPVDLPRALTPCPVLKGNGMYRFGDPSRRNLMVDVYVAPDAKTKPGSGGPLILYWHALGSNSAEVMQGLGQAAIDEVIGQGGMVASFNTKLCATCGLADDAVWYDEDDPVTDHVVACAVEQAHIDVRHIHSVGFSAGALRSLHLALARSNYIASVVSYSGGMTDEVNALDPNNKVPAILSYGSQGLDTIGFKDLSLAWYETNRVRGYYSMLCAHDGPHVIPVDLVPQALRFLRDHPYRVQPEPYATAIPTGYPKYCGNEP